MTPNSVGKNKNGLKLSFGSSFGLTFRHTLASKFNLKIFFKPKFYPTFLFLAILTFFVTQVAEEHPGARQRGRGEDAAGEQVRPGGQARGQQEARRRCGLRERHHLPRDVGQDRRERREGFRRTDGVHP